MDDYTQEERDALANMLMRSLRGNWGTPHDRTELLIDLAEAGLSDYDSEKVKERAENFLKRSPRDGRTFRPIYEDGPTLPEQTDAETVKALVGHVPAGDMTFDANWIDRRFGP